MRRSSRASNGLQITSTTATLRDSCSNSDAAMGRWPPGDTGSLVLTQSANRTKELAMNPNEIADADLVTLPSAHTAIETVDRFKSLLGEKKIHLFAEVDHAAAAMRV